MVLVLSVLRCPEKVVAEQRRVLGGEYLLGRGSECDWQFQDSGRTISKRHCAVEYLSGGWQLRDLSSNGTYLNGASQPVGRDQVVRLNDRDRLLLGAWEIECRIKDEAGFGEARWQSASALPDPMSSGAAASDGNLFGVPLPGMGSAAGLPGDGALIRPAGMGHDLGMGMHEDAGSAMPDHRPSMNDAFVRPPMREPDLLPMDWDRPPSAAPLDDVFAALPDPFADGPPPGSAPSSFPANFSSLASRGENPFAEPGVPGGALPVPPADAMPDFAAEFAPAAPLVPPVVAPAPSPPMPVATPQPPVVNGLRAALDLLLQGAGLPASPPGTDPAEALTQAGEALREAVSALRALLIARADVKREFRIEQTLLRAVGNNPMKFAASNEAAISALLTATRGQGVASLREAADDLAAHQLATLAATQAAARALLVRLAPAGLEAESPSAGLSLPGARERRLWEAYKRLHRQVTDQFEDDFDSAFGKAFARSYEQALRGGL